MATDPVWLDRAVENVFRDAWESESLDNYSELQNKFVFHMTEAAEEIRQFCSWLSSKEEPASESFGRFLRRFFLDAVPHLVAAGQLFDYVPEIFPEQKGVHSIDPLRLRSEEDGK